MCSKGIIWAMRMTIMGLTLTLFATQGTSANAAAPYFKVHGLPPGAVLWVRSGPGPQFKRIRVFPGYGPSHPKLRLQKICTRDLVPRGVSRRTRLGSPAALVQR